MACCTGVTECDQLITIGFLKTFIGSDIKSSVNGSTLSVNTSESDSYCPTYAELTGGTLVQNWKQGTTANGDRDGIIIGDTYANNQCVKRTHLSMKYTRFSTFTISVSPATISACSGTSTLSFTHEYIRYTKSLNGKCESAATPTSSGVSDTASGEVTYTSSNNVFSISGNKVTVGKNNPNGNGRSTARSTTITGKVTFRGTNHQSQKTITQSGLSGDYVFSASTYSITNKDISCHGGPSFGCEGGNYSAEATHTLNTWDIYVYEDSCGTRYTNDKDIRNSSSTTVTAYTYNGSFSDKTGQCGRWEDSKSWDGYGSCSWTQSCTTCPCSSYTEWNEGTYTGTVDCSGGTVAMNNITIPGTYHYKYVDPQTSECVEELTPTSKTESASVNFSCNTNTTSKTHTGVKNGIRYTITQPAGPCCQPNSTTSYTTVYLSCDAHNNEEISTSYTVRTTGSCCETSSGSYRTGVYYATIGCNSGTTRTLNNTQKGGAPFTVYQRGNCNCCTCDNADLNVASTAAGSSVPGSGYTASTIVGTYNSSTCLTALTVSSNVNWITNLSLSNGNIYGKVSSNPSMTDGRNAIITVSGKDGKNNSCSGTCSINQFKLDCTCDNANLNVAATSAGSSIPANGYTTVTTIGTYNNNTCLTGLTVSSSENWVTNVSLSNGNVNAKVSENVSLANDRNSTITVKGINGSGGECASAFTVTQVKSATTCTCENINLNAIASAAGLSIPAAGYSSSTTIGTYNNGTCLTNITATSSQNWATVSVSNGNVNATVQANTSLTNDRNSTITVQGIDALGSTCSDTFNIKQVMSAITCVCSDLTINKTSETWDYNVTTSKDITITSASCISNIATGGTLTHFTATISSGKVTVQPNGNNTTYSAYTETFNITYKASGNDCSSAITLTQNPNQCVCTNLTVSPTSLSWSANSISSKDITVTSASCITNISLSSPAHFYASLSNNKISVSPKGNNPSCSAYSDTLVVSYEAGNNTCFSSVTLTQNATACTCNNLTVSPTSLIWEFNNTTSKNVTVTSASCITNISLNEPSHFNASLNNGSIIITPKSQNTGNVDYVDTLIVSYSDGGIIITPESQNTGNVDCVDTLIASYSGYSIPCSSAITLTQKVSECLCENVNLNVSVTAAGVSIPSTGYSASTVIGTYNNSTCLTSITATSNQNWVTNITVSNGNVSAKVSENTNIGENRSATINVFGFDGVGVACMGTFNVSQTNCTPGVAWEIEPVKITCDAVDVGSVLCDTNLTKTEIYIEDGICKKRTTTYNTVHIWNDPPASVIPANDTNNDKTLYINVYTDGTNFFTTSDAAGGGPSIGICVVTQLKCIESCVPGTDNAYNESTGAREPVHLECSIDAITTDQYLGNWVKDQHVYGRNQESGEKQNVSSFTVNEGSTVGWQNYLEFLNANDVVQEYPDITNSYGAKSLQANDLGEDIWLKVKHVIINKNIQPPLSNTCDEWYSFIQFRPCDPYTYNVYSNVEGARVDFYSNTSSSHHYGYGFINNGICYKEIKYNSVKVVISKDGCTFSPNEVVMSNGGSVTLNGNCSAPPQTQYTYTVYGDSNSNGATVIFYYGGTAINSGSIANGSYTFVTTTNYGRIDVSISKSDCIITPSSTTLDADSSVSVTASCSGPQPTYYTYTVNGNSDANGATVILSYNLLPVADGVITNGYYTFTTTTYYDSLDAYISKNGCTITPDSTSILVNNSVTVTADCSGPQPSYYTYTVNDSNGNAEGAYITWWYNGTQFDTTTIVNGVSQITREDGVTVDVVVMKDGCTASYSPGSSISANGSITVTMNCGSASCSNPSLDSQTYYVSTNGGTVSIVYSNPDCGWDVQDAYASQGDFDKVISVSPYSPYNCSTHTNVNLEPNSHGSYTTIIILFACRHDGSTTTLEARIEWDSGT